MKKDYAAIFQKIEQDDVTYYVPIDVAEGIYSERNNTFTAHNVALKHIIAGEDYGYCNREKLTEIVNKRKYLGLPITRKILLTSLRKGTYIRIKHESEPPFIRYIKNDENKVLTEDDITNYYTKYFSEKIKYKDSTSKEKTLNIKIDINKIYNAIKKKIPTQDDHIKEILSIIWRNFNNYQNTKSRSMLINGEKGSHKKEIFNTIEENITIPVLNTSIINRYKNNIELNSVSDILINLLKKCNYDIKKVETSIIVIDDIDTITISDQSDVQLFSPYQTDLAKLINGFFFTVEIDGDSYTIDTSKMFIVLMGDFMKPEEEISLIKGFHNIPDSQKKNTTKTDYITQGLIEELATSIQTIIELDKPTREEYIESIKKNENNSLNISKKFLQSLNIKLTVEDTAIKRISEIIEKNGYSEEQIDEMIDKALSQATFEIAITPNAYEELIIDEETISNNNKYKLVRRRK